MLPKVNSIFRLAKPTDLRYSASGVAVCKLYLVASEKYKDKESTLWIGSTAFGKTAEFIATIQKGQRVFISGKIQTDEWTNQQGEKQSRITMLIDSFEYIEKRDNATQPNQTTVNSPQQAQTASNNGQQPTQQAPRTQKTAPAPIAG